MTARRPSAALAYNLYLKHDLLKVAEAFEVQRIPWMVIKGVALAESVYGGLAERPMVDNDIVVPPERIVDAHQTLTRLGFYDRPGCTLELSRGADYEHQMHFPHAAVETGMELHWHVYAPELFRGGVGLFFERAVMRRLAGTWMLTLSNEDRLLQLATHWAGHGLNKPAVLKDIELLWNHQEAAEHTVILDDLLRQLRRAGALDVLALALLLLDKGARLKHPIPDALRTRRAEGFARLCADRLDAVAMSSTSGGAQPTALPAAEELQLRLLSWLLLTPSRALASARREFAPSRARLSRIAGRSLTNGDAIRFFASRQGQAISKLFGR
jgi:hypothetical protein